MFRQSEDGGRSSQDVSGVGGSGQDEMQPMDFHQTGTGTFHHPPTSSGSRSSFGRSYATTAAIETDFD